MVHLVVLCKINTNVADDEIEEIARAAQTQLLKVPEVLAVRAGRRIDHSNEWPFYYSVEFDSMAKLKRFRDDPVQLRFIEKFIKPKVWTQLEMLYELEPGKDIRYS